MTSDAAKGLGELAYKLVCLAAVALLPYKLFATPRGSEESGPVRPERK